jgi:cytochrome b
MKEKYLVWDIPTRLFHWLLVMTFACSWATYELGSDYMQYHVYSGYFMLFLLSFRIVWGFVGTVHARFSSFFPTLNRVADYLQAAQVGNNTNTAGHNPLGAAMVFLMLLLLLGQVVSGLFISDDVFTQGPYYGAVEGNWEKLFNSMHDLCFTALQICIALHVAAIVFYKLVKKVNLVLPMFHGKKSADEINENDAIENSRLAVALLVAILAVVFVYWLVVINAPVIEEFYYY